MNIGQAQLNSELGRATKSCRTDENATWARSDGRPPLLELRRPENSLSLSGRLQTIRSGRSISAFNQPAQSQFRQPEAQSLQLSNVPRIHLLPVTSKLYMHIHQWCPPGLQHVLTIVHMHRTGCMTSSKTRTNNWMSHHVSRLWTIRKLQHVKR